MSHDATMTDPGFYGKLPVYGDFIQKRLPRDFISPWDEWLQTGLAAAKERLPQEWLTYYLNCPAWTFVLGDGICGEQPCAGVTIPSVDRVGRYFNFTLASLLPPGTAPAPFLMRHRPWLQDLEELALNILGDELDQDQIDVAINAFTPLSLDGLDARPAIDRGEDYLRLTFGTAENPSDPLQSLLHTLIENRGEGSYGLWLQGGSNQVSPQILCCQRMPATELFLDMMISADAEEPKTEGDDVLDEFLSS